MNSSTGFFNGWLFESPNRGMNHGGPIKEQVILASLHFFTIFFGHVCLLSCSPSRRRRRLAGRHWYVEHISAMPDWALPASFLILLGVYGLIIFELIDRALAAVVGGIVAVFTLHIIAAGDPNTTGPDLLDVVVWIDMETVGLLMGMMIIVGVLSETGIFQWAAVEAYARSGGSIWRLMVILAVVTAVF
ncbi:MAG: SLC13 family permease, partial [Candidatus Thermoplasmatota archaeon]|nr:SLC13 family permease [Candidatus Thermoplasmatota archaeon]